MATATAMALATAMAPAVAMLLLKMDENVNLRTELFFYCVQFSSWHKFFYIFQNIG